MVDSIEGTPHIGTVPVEPGLTNAVSEKNGERLVGFNTENGEVNEGLIRFDIVFLCTYERWFITDYYKCGGTKKMNRMDMKF